MTKTHLSAVVVVPPKEVWEPIQAIRRAHDKQFRRWLPHVTLLYPFAPKRDFNKVLPELAQVGWAHRPFTLTFASFGSFRHGRDYTLWLEPDPAAPLIALQAALTQALPTFGDTGSFKGGFTPHLSVGQTDKAKLERLKRDLQANWQPLTFTVSELALISRKDPPNDIFQIDQRIRLEG